MKFWLIAVFSVKDGNKNNKIKLLIIHIKILIIFLNFVFPQSIFQTKINNCIKKTISILIAKFSSLKYAKIVDCFCCFLEN
ncbi:hypothetical protein BSN82_12725 [Acinetobacter baylyi]|nr:hypothetical protein BSN81_01920 [Acinetobacter baylyi]KAF2382461.1 hypothetical protein BSN82_12725 [Acinetobacter baylyi]MAK30471.1 hypothetical protein [Acinetobacter sp.]